MLALKLLRVNAALRTKMLYAERLEYLLHERSERIDELNGQLEKGRRSDGWIRSASTWRT